MPAQSEIVALKADDQLKTRVVVADVVRRDDDQLKNRAPPNDPAISISESQSPTQAKLSEPKNSLMATIVAWYGSSVICTNTSKSLGLPWQLLTLAQLMIGSLCAYVGITVFRLNGRPTSRLVELFPTCREILVWQSTTVLAATFVGGFVTLNMALRKMHVSTVMVVRAAEPVATLLLGLYFLPNEKTSCLAVLALIPVVAGAGMASIAPGSSNTSADDNDEFWSGLSIVLLCNCLFALRTIFTRRLKAACPSLDNFTLFFQLCVVGTALHLVLLCGMILFSMLNSKRSHDDSSKPFSMDWKDSDDSFLLKLMVLVLNGISFYGYLQLSWVVMGQVPAVTHSVCNALRRPVICAAGWLLFGGATVEGVVGALMATGGTMLYAQAKRRVVAAAAATTDFLDDRGGEMVDSDLQSKVQAV